MLISFKNFWLPKFGNSIEEYEDAFFPEDEIFQDNLDSFCCSIADGATETSFSQSWAKLLVYESCKNYIESIEYLFNFLPIIQKKWLEKHLQLKLPWYAEEKLLKGAFSTITTFSIKENKDIIEFTALSVGDSCFFHIRDNQLLKKFPIDDSINFNNNPVLISTDTISNNNLLDNIKIFSSIANKNDIFYIMTDALACWFLKEFETGNKPWENLYYFIEKKSEFPNFINNLRENKLIKNDDVTLLYIEIK